jgi:hypothetical protein
MPVHDWTKIDAGTFHDFHSAWIIHLKETLNNGMLPDGYYAMAEQHAGGRIPDVLTLQIPGVEPTWGPTAPDRGLMLADAPPRTRRKLTASPDYLYRSRRRTLAIRHASGHRIVALLEICSPANKDRPSSVEQFVTKVDSALRLGIHVLVVDLFPPGKHDPQGMHGAIWASFDAPDEEVPADQPLTLASYVADPAHEAYVEYIAVGDQLPEMPLFLDRHGYISAPLETTYQSAFRGMPAFWRDALGNASPDA